jgi:hypothetical protein
MPSKQTNGKAAPKRGTSKKTASKKTGTKKQAPEPPESLKTHMEAPLPYVELIEVPVRTTELQTYLHNQQTAVLEPEIYDNIQRHLRNLRKSCDQQVEWSIGRCNAPPSPNQKEMAEHHQSESIRTVSDILTDVGAGDLIMLLNDYYEETDNQWPLRLIWFGIPAMQFALTQERSQVESLARGYLDELGMFIGSFNETNSSRGTERCIAYSVSLCLALLDAFSLASTAECLKEACILPETLRGNWTAYFRDVVVPRLKSNAISDITNQPAKLEPLGMTECTITEEAAEPTKPIVVFSRNFKFIDIEGTKTQIATYDSHRCPMVLSVLYDKQSNAEGAESEWVSNKEFPKDVDQSITMRLLVKDLKPPELKSAMENVIKVDRKRVGRGYDHRFRLNPAYRYELEKEP